MAGRLQADEAARRRFFQDAAHELKTPLSVIDATTAAILDGVYPHDAKHLETIRGQKRLLTRIVDDLQPDTAGLRVVAVQRKAELAIALTLEFRARQSGHRPRRPAVRRSGRGLGSR